MADSPIKTVGDLIAALKQYADDWPIYFEHITAREWARGIDPLFEYSVDYVVLDLDTEAVRLLSIGDADDDE
ncbi:hypothetical protein AB0I72_27355 [Nocardiopsis sp. NPDC049922]|uniref:hypothetical protein n=1 Tax=Nocardiopsis sp. NPDC049922 TaxID=3155157 RepID=UPI0033F8E0E6